MISGSMLYAPLWRSLSIHSRRLFCTTNQQDVAGDAVRRCLTVSHASEETLRCFMKGQAWALQGRVDAQDFHRRAAKNQFRLHSLQYLHHSPKSALLPMLRPIGFLFGAAAAYAPESTRMAIYGALQESISDTYNDHIRTLRSNGSLDRDVELKKELVRLRDEDRVPEGAIPPPDLSHLQRIEEISLSQGIGAAVKGTCRLTMRALSRE